MINEREHMMHRRSRSMDSIHQRSRRSSYDHNYQENNNINNNNNNNNNNSDDENDDDADYNESDSSVTRIFKRRMPRTSITA
ncbi:unnamed protein product, partial [Rotaria sp. Silwood2]